MADLLQTAKDRYDEAREAWRENYGRALEDQRFTNPAEPQQWTREALETRRGRPCMTFDRTNQFIGQVVNDVRQGKPGILISPSDDEASDEAAKELTGLIRQIEHDSRAHIAYEVAAENVARCGFGWLRVTPKVIEAEGNIQTIQISAVHDPLSCLIDPDSQEPDGQDARYAFALSVMTKRAFEAQYGKKKARAARDWEIDGEWYRGSANLVETVLLAEYMSVESKTIGRLDIVLPGGELRSVTEDEYWQIAQEIGTQPMLIGKRDVKVREVTWAKMCGDEVLEETEFPSEYLGLIPVYGDSVMIEGKRYVCGLGRKLRDGQQAYNFERSAFIEAIALQPKAPFMAPFEAIKGLESYWNRLNTGNPAYLPFNHRDEDGEILPNPQRMMPPAFPAAYAQGGQIASADMEAAVGMYKANLGQQGNETSGRAINARKAEGDTATFHYHDNLGRSIAQLGRVIVSMIPRVMDSPRTVRTMNEDMKPGFMRIDPEMPQSFAKDEQGTTTINPTRGKYDVTVKVGPSAATMRDQSAQDIVEISQGNPALGAALAPLLIKLRGLPEAEKISRVALAMLPPPVQQAYSDEEEQIPPQVMAQMQAMQQELQQAQEIVRNLAQQLEEAQGKQQSEQGKLAIDAYRAETDRAAALMQAQAAAQVDPNVIAPMVQTLVMQTLQTLIANPQPEMPPEPTPEMMPAEPQFDSAPDMDVPPQAF